MLGYTQAYNDMEKCKLEDRKKDQEARNKSEKYKVELRNMIEGKKFDEL